MTPANDLTEGLNPAQCEAVTTIHGPLMVMAGAGSGKTRVITHRVAHLISSGIPPENILAVTFTNKAAREMRDRINRLVGPPFPTVCTFHSFGARLLREEAHRLGLSQSFSLFDRSDSEAAMKRVIKGLKLDSNTYTPSALLSYVGDHKSQLVSAEEAVNEAHSDWENDAARAYTCYEIALKESEALDFDDLLYRTVKLLDKDEELRSRLDSFFRFVLVDEYQDVNAAQYRLAEQLTTDKKNLCVTGDPDQCIYTWRGADIRYMLNFEKTHPDCRVVKLEQNYRSSPTILDVANNVIRFNSNRADKQLWSDLPQGEPVEIARVVDDNEEGRLVVERVQALIHQGVPPGDIAIFYRLNSLSPSVERAFMFEGIPYQIVHGLEFFKRREVKDAMAWVRYILNPSDDVAFRRIINTPARGIGARTLEIVADGARKLGVATGVLARTPERLGTALTQRARKALDGFAAIVTELCSLDQSESGVFLEKLIDRTGLSAALTAKGTQSGADPLGNIYQLIAFGYNHDQQPDSEGLRTFLDNVSLLSDIDTHETDAEKVVLMTLHAAKGLEFPHVFIIGMDRDILPHKGLHRPADEEEERRLFYVGLTRAMKSVCLTTTSFRTRFGRCEPSAPSDFLNAVPEELSVINDQAGGVPMTDHETSIEYDLDEMICVQKGARVYHPEWGAGSVKRVRGRGTNARVTIDFDRSGDRTLSLAFSGLSAEM